jgi:hypothetical protein
MTNESTVLAASMDDALVDGSLGSEALVNEVRRVDAASETDSETELVSSSGFCGVRTVADMSMAIDEHPNWVGLSEMPPSI